METEEPIRDKNESNKNNVIDEMMDELVENVIENVNAKTDNADIKDEQKWDNKNKATTINLNDDDLDDIRGLYKYINSVQVDVNKHTTIFLDVWELIQKLMSKLISLDNVADSISEVSGRVLINEVNIEKHSDIITSLMLKKKTQQKSN